MIARKRTGGGRQSEGTPVMLAISLALLLATSALLPSAVQSQPPAAKPVAQNEAAESPAPEKLDPQHAQKMKAGVELFQKEVRPVLVGRCVKCHGGETTEGEFDLNTREGLLKASENGAQVVAGKPQDSRLLKLIRQEIEPKMPEDGAKLPDRQIAAIAQWIELGAPYDKPLLDKNVRPDAWIHNRVAPEARQFWSFQAIRRVDPPAVKDSSWCRTPLDHFVLAKLQEKQLTPHAAASRERLIRRAYFDVLGLPPTPAEIDQFVADQDPQAYTRLLDRLFENPHYGERWGRHWLDVARFAESHGFEQDYDRPHAYHYRDFVIRALNDDMPYDQFVRWQIAGDEFEPNNPLAMMATGFLGAGVFPTQLTEKEFEPARYDELDDMVGTMGTAMLGLTIGCARCHDHKFDPIPAADYYRMAATFSTAIRSNVDLELQSDETKQKLTQWQSEHEPLVAAVREFESKQLPARFDAWLKERRAKAGQGDNGDPSAKGDRTTTVPAWYILDAVQAVSKGGATLTKQEDGSLLATGKNPDFDQYTIVAQTHLTNITSLRLEALAHDSMTRKGPGRAPNGNIGLSRIRVQAAPLAGAGEPITLKLVNPRATFQQDAGTLSIASSLDDNPKSGWTVDPQFGKDHAAGFDVEQPFGFPQGTKITITLEFDLNNHHNIGRPRLAISTSASPVALDGAAQPQHIIETLALLDRTTEPLTAAQRERVLAWFRTTDADWKMLQERVVKHEQQKPQPKRTQVMIVSEGVKPIPHHADGRGFPHFYPETSFLKRGDVTQKQGVATQDFLQVLMPVRPAAASSSAATAGNAGGSTTPVNEHLARWQSPAVEGSKTSQRRKTLANWLTDTEAGAGHLLARVIVNRLWQHHFGRGIVSTPNDFGMQGVRPTHPELLDYLAAELIRNQWRLKPIHKLMMSSAVYCQDSQHDAADAAIDPDNQWLWRYSPVRLQAEVIRDNMLAVSGTLDPTMFGPGTLNEGHKRRSIYFFIKRSQLIPSMQLFDAPEPLVSVGGRPSTTIAPQALLFMNNPQVRGYAQQLGAKLLPIAEKSWEEAVTLGYRTTVGRAPTAAELADTVAFLERQSASYAKQGKANGKALALADFSQVLMSLNEFVYVE